MTREQRMLKRIAEHLDEQLMRLAFGGHRVEPTTLYVDKYGRTSTVNPELYRRNRDQFGNLIVSS